MTFSRKRIKVILASSVLNFGSFNYVPDLYKRLRYAVKKFNINLIASMTEKLKDLVHIKIDTIPRHEISGIYIIPLITETQEEKVYIGMTSRKFKERLKEHIQDIRYDRQNTALARLNRKQNMHIVFNEAKIIIHSSHYQLSLIKESIETGPDYRIGTRSTYFPYRPGGGSTDNHLIELEAEILELLRT